MRLVAPIAKRQKEHRGTKYSMRTFPTVEYPTHRGPAKRGTPYSPWTCPTADHPAHRGPAPAPNTLLTVDLPHCRTFYSLWTCRTAEHPSHLGPSPTRNTLLIVDLPHRGTPYSPSGLHQVIISIIRDNRNSHFSQKLFPGSHI